MAGPPPKQPRLSDKGRQARHDRETRLAEALRDNLRKRKAQARGRRGAGQDAADRTAGGGPGGPRDDGEA